MQKVFNLFSTLLFCLTLVIYALPTKVLAADSGMAKVIITEVKLGGGTDPKEFVSIYNQSDQPIDLSTFRLEYIKDDFTGNCDLVNWGGPPSTIRALSGVLNPAEEATFKYNLNNDSTLTDSRSGSIRLIESSNITSVVHDLVAWGDSAVCYETKSAPQPASGKSLQRYMDCDSSLPIDTNDNSKDFIADGEPTPGVLGGPLTDDCTSSDPSGGDNSGGESAGTGDGQGTAPQNNCGGIIISELLPNPAGSDTDNEFIELHNTSDATVSLTGCKLQTTDSSKMYELGEIRLEPGQYKAFYNYETGLTLPNSSGGSVYLVNSDGSEDVSAVDYPSSLDDDVSWSFIGGDWVRTFSITQGSANKLLTLKPCPSGEFRNPDTNRCNNIVAEAAGLGACAPGKERNPETHRCRLVASLATALKACAPDQFRNPATNRCKKLAGMSSLKPCKPGQERNAQTHRCRKITGASSGKINDVKDVLSAQNQTDKTSWVISAGAVFGALIYGIWEWRNEIVQIVGGLKSKFA